MLCRYPSDAESMQALSNDSDLCSKSKRVLTDGDGAWNVSGTGVSERDVHPRDEWTAIGVPIDLRGWCNTV